MTEGLKVKMDTEELEAHLTLKAEYHAKRKAEKQAELPALKDALRKIKSIPAATSVATFSKGHGYALDTEDTVERLERDIADHHNRALAFGFYAKHLIPGGYVLKQEDLVTLEIIKR